MVRSKGYWGLQCHWLNSTSTSMNWEEGRSDKHVPRNTFTDSYSVDRFFEFYHSWFFEQEQYERQFFRPSRMDEQQDIRLIYTTLRFQLIDMPGFSNSDSFSTMISFPALAGRSTLRNYFYITQSSETSENYWEKGKKIYPICQSTLKKINSKKEKQTTKVSKPPLNERPVPACFFEARCLKKWKQDSDDTESIDTVPTLTK